MLQGVHEWPLECITLLNKRFTAIISREPHLYISISNRHKLFQYIIGTLCIIQKQCCKAVHLLNTLQWFLLLYNILQ